MLDFILSPHRTIIQENRPSFCEPLVNSTYSWVQRRCN